MATLTVTKNYADDTILTEEQLDDAYQSIETFLNTTKISDDNIQTGGVGTASIAGTSVTTSKIAANAVTKPKIEVSQQLPPGMMAPFAGSSSPSGWLLCDGSAVNRITYSDLFAVIGITHGQGDGSTTFHLPDPRGRTIRGVDGGAGLDPDAAGRTAPNAGANSGDNVGSIQADLTRAHGHPVVDPGHSHTIPNTLVQTGSGVTIRQDVGNPFAASAGIATSSSGTSITVQNTSGSETRMTNLGLHYIIKT